jgi:hypothetical protein
MRVHVLGIALGVVLSACSSSSGGGAGGTQGEGGMPGSCSSPGSVKGTCTTQMDGGIHDCIEFTGSGYSASMIANACMGNGAMAGTGSCPTGGQIGGHCISSCGQANEAVFYYYSGSGMTPMGAQSSCTMTRGMWVP